MTLDDLVALATAANEAKERYRAMSARNSMGLTGPEQVIADLKYREAMREHVRTEEAYQKALDEFAKQQTAAHQPTAAE